MKGMLGDEVTVVRRARHPTPLVCLNSHILYFIGECLKLIQNVQTSPCRPAAKCVCVQLNILKMPYPAITFNDSNFLFSSTTQIKN